MNIKAPSREFTKREAYVHTQYIIDDEGRELRITSNVVIKDSTYTGRLTAAYLRLLDYSRKVFLQDFHLHGII